MDKEGDPQQSSELIAELPINVRYGTIYHNQ